MSVELPAPTGTTARIGLAGQPWAHGVRGGKSDQQENKRVHVTSVSNAAILEARS
jgi:hypothetical protein